MKTCDGCKYAGWKKTKAGRLHPSGDGYCMYEFKMPKLSNAKHYAYCLVSGGAINRRRAPYETHCPYYAEGEYVAK